MVDLISGIRTPPPPAPDLSDPQQCRLEFEELNYGSRLWYTKEILNLLYSSKDELDQALGC